MTEKPLTQPSLYPDYPDHKIPWKKLDIAYTLDFEQTNILRNIMRLHNDGEPFDCDVTYSKGVFYKHLPEPAHKFDLDPQQPDVSKADARELPVEDNTFSSLIFDPPFKASNSKVKGIIEQRFTAFASVADLWDFYEDAVFEHYRVLAPGGLYVVKCQDTVSSGKNHFSSFEIQKYARAVGFTPIDLFVLGARSVIMSPNMVNQKHARKNHSFLLVFRKPK